MFRDVSRKKQSLSAEKIADILKNEKRGVLSVHGENGYPYGLPINYWFDEENGYVYFHSGKKGHKTDAISSDNKVSFCVYDEGYKKDGEWALNISSVIIFGRMYIVEDPEKSAEIFRRLSLKFTSDTEYIDSEIEKFAKDTVCYELRPEHITGKIVNES
ncbi:MAG: pyridoxamine 5'-phosphate oxidase family protein [Acutalibacteraceae bacterium]|nr:pyridoxamine 5'-phosphate oxidase family protein [Acutalibacteraceae bacterium]